MAWQRVASVSEVTEGTPLLIVLAETDIAIFRVGDEVFATDDICSHAEASLCEGDQHGYLIECPRHGGRFDIRTGQAKKFPAISAIQTFPVKIEEGNLFIDDDELT